MTILPPSSGLIMGALASAGKHVHLELECPSHHDITSGLQRPSAESPQ
eukprot:CAMPEP_0119407600 /NCGR_PEP_ID=MMETSP1335-20130426/1432_1 /TAXON_ID=259385 /ORGANISM="Chrysoculter rhomboideus, Strain RCC1486" /LENGTH=47 /DNA_ID= /DNA_START= /DNA_END= /DNA_ORIENTATION=